MTTQRGYLAIGRPLGLTWAAALRGWTAQLAAGESDSTVIWLTLVLVLHPGLVIGLLLGWSAYLRATRSVGEHPLRIAAGRLRTSSVGATAHAGSITASDHAAAAH